MKMLKRLLSLLIILMLAFSSTIDAYAIDQFARVITIHSMGGDSVTLSHDNAPGSTPRVRQRLATGNILTTGRNSYVYLQMDRDSILRMDERSSVAVGSSGRQMSLTLQSGSVLVNVEGQSEGETLSSRVGNVGLGVRGTMFTMGRGATDIVTIVMLSGLGYVNDVPLPAGAMMIVWDGLDDRHLVIDGVLETGQYYEIRFALEMGILDLNTLMAIYEHNEYLLNIGTVTYEDIAQLPELIELRQAERDAEAEAEYALIEDILLTIEQENIVYLPIGGDTVEDTDTGAPLPQIHPPIYLPPEPPIYQPVEPPIDMQPDAQPEPPIDTQPDMQPEPPIDTQPEPTPVWQCCDADCGVVIADGLTGTVGGDSRAPWRLYACGTLAVDEGFIQGSSPWLAYSADITRIEFLGPIAAGSSLAGLFANLTNVTEIEGLSHFDTRNVTTMSDMFSEASSLTSLDLSDWDTSNVTDMMAMFASASSLTSLDLTSFDTNNVTNMDWMFAQASSLTSLDLTSFDTSNVASMFQMFSSANSLTSLDLTNFDTSNVKDMRGMFMDANSLTSLDLTSFNTSNVARIELMFQGANSLTTLMLGANFSFGDGNSGLRTGYWQNQSTGHVSTSAQLMTNSFGSTMTGTWAWSSTAPTALCPDCGADCDVVASGLTGTQSNPATAVDDRAPWRLHECGVLVVDSGFIESDFYLDDLDIDIVLEVSLWSAHRFDIERIVFTGPITAATSLSGLFVFLSNLTEIEGLSHFNTSNVTDMSGMFDGASSLTSIDLSGFNTSNVTDMQFMFGATTSLASLDLSGFDTSNVTNMSGMFAFAFASGLTSFDLSGFDTSNVTNMSGMFAFATGLTSLDLSGFDTSSVTDMLAMFQDTHSLTSLDLSNFDTSNVTNMSFMFNNAHSLTSLDLSSFDTSSVTSMSNMFYGANSLSTLTLGMDFSFVSGDAVGLRDGYWQHDGTGTAYSSSQLMENYPATTPTGMEGTWTWHDTMPSVIIASGLTGDVGGDARAPWRLYESGLLVVDSGFIQGVNWATSPWSAHRLYIERIVFTGLITAGSSLSGLFSNLPNVTEIKGLSHFNTNNVTNMDGMFMLASSLTSLNLSSFDTSNVTNMGGMFEGASLLTSLDLTSFDTSNVWSMHNMFAGLTSLSSLILGANFSFIDGDDAGLRTGYWLNVEADEAYSSSELMHNQPAMTPTGMAGTWTWSLVSPTAAMLELCDELLLDEYDLYYDEDDSDYDYYRKEDDDEKAPDPDAKDDDDSKDNKTPADDGSDCAANDDSPIAEETPPDSGGDTGSETETAIEAALEMLDELLEKCG